MITEIGCDMNSACTVLKQLPILVQTYVFIAAYQFSH